MNREILFRAKHIHTILGNEHLNGICASCNTGNSSADEGVSYEDREDDRGRIGKARK